MSHNNNNNQCQASLPENAVVVEVIKTQDEQLQEILALMHSRAAGGATNEQIEQAVKRILGPAATAVIASDNENENNITSSDHAQARLPCVQADTDDYDADEAETEVEKEAPLVNNGKMAAHIKSSGEALLSTTETTKDTTTSSGVQNKIDWAELYGDIPLGQQGARMMQTFGDGSPPLPETVRATLQGARRMVQVAIQDTRHVRRERKKVFNEAQAMLKADVHRLKRGKKKGATSNSSTSSSSTKVRSINQWSPELLYRVHTGYDSLAYDPKCGFDTEDLEQLYPEEMNAYKRWNSNYKAYEDKNMEKANADGEEQSNNDEDSKSGGGGGGEALDVQENNNEKCLGGHLQERAAQFDVRTDQMKGERYIEFAELRKGSFLPRRMAASEEQQISNATDADAAAAGGWGNLPPIAIRFLHWVGFSPDSALPPPNLFTTQCLAFLAYDFVGRIVEKAIELRLKDCRKASSIGIDAPFELLPGERLEVKDIERAMQDPEIHPAPLHCSGDGDDKVATAGPQLYFGPGFEYRLEMELDELVATGSRNNKKIRSEDQVKKERDTTEKEEEDMFQHLAKRQHF